MMIAKIALLLSTMQWGVVNRFTMYIPDHFRSINQGKRENEWKEKQTKNRHLS